MILGHLFYCLAKVLNDTRQYEVHLNIKTFVRGLNRPILLILALFAKHKKIYVDRDKQPKALYGLCLRPGVSVCLWLRANSVFI